MRLVKPSFEIMNILKSGIEADHSDYGTSLEVIERAGRVCYKSEDGISPGTAKKFVQKIISLGHESVLEHSAMTVKFICDRGVSHELVRHRLCAFSQESTRYCNYKGGVTFVIPSWIELIPGTYHAGDIHDLFPDFCPEYDWFVAMLNAESRYISLLSKWSPQQARSVLPNSLKTEIVVTANFREWRHIFNLRCSKAAHPQMREIMIPLLEECKKLIPIIFNEIKYE